MALFRFMDWPLRAKMAALLAVASFVPLAVAAFIDIRDTRHVGTDRLDDSGTFVTEHGRAPRLCRPVDRIEVRMAHAARVEPHEYLVPPGGSELEVLDVVRAPGLLEDGRADLHAGACFCKRRNSSSGMWQRIK